MPQKNPRTVAISIRKFIPEDGEGITALFREVYGNHYLDPVVYDPKMLVEKNNSKMIMSVVAKDQFGKVVGHVAAVCRDVEHGVYEMAQGAVHPKTRGRSILSEMLSFSLDLVENFQSCNVLYAEPVTNHVFTQKPLIAAGFRDTGILYNFVPGEMMQQEEGKQLSVAILMQFRPRKDRSAREVHLPARYIEIAEAIYGSLKLGRTILTDGIADGANRMHCRFNVQENTDMGCVKIYVTAPGKNINEVNGVANRALSSRSFRLVHCYVPIKYPESINTVNDLQNVGFTFGAILPNWWGDDVILMQKTADTETSNIPLIYSEIGKRIKKHIELERQIYRLIPRLPTETSDQKVTETDGHNAACAALTDAVFS